MNAEKSIGSERTIGPVNGSVASEPALRGGEIFGPFRVIALLGRGTMGEVYEVVRIVDGVSFALKLMGASLGQDGIAVARFQQETSVLRELKSPFIIAAAETGRVSGRLWLSMQLCPGLDVVNAKGQMQRVRSLDEYADACGGALRQSELFALMDGLLAGLAYAHDKGIVHRDLKPANILLAPGADGHLFQPLISDFGLVRIVGEERVCEEAKRSIGLSLTRGAVGDDEAKAWLGNWAYMSPEQKRGQPATKASDLYAVGLLAYRLGTGKDLGLEAASELNTELAPEWDAFIGTALEELPQNRYANAQDMRKALGYMHAVWERREAASRQAGKPAEQALRHARHSLTHSWAPSVAAVIGVLSVAVVMGLAALLFGGRGSKARGAQHQSAQKLSAKAAPSVAEQPAASLKEAPGARAVLEKAVALYELYSDRKGKTEEMRQLFQQAAEMNSPLAKFWVALLTNKGLGGFSQNHEHAQRRAVEVIGEISRLAEAGDPEAAALLSDAYQAGLGVTKDTQLMAQWMRKAATLGCARSMFFMGMLYESGITVPKDAAAAGAWYLKAAEKGNTQAMLKMSLFSKQGRGMPANGEEALKWSRLAAESGNSGGMFNLGLMYASGQGTPTNDVEAVKWFKQAAERGHKQAMVVLAGKYAWGNGVVSNDVEAANWYRHAAEAGDVDSMFYLAQRCFTGRGVPTNPSEGIKWYSKAAESGDSKAMNALGKKYAKGIGVSTNEAKAVQLFRDAAELGHAEAMNNLGWMCQNGFGTPKDLTEAIKWYRKAIELGEDEAMSELGGLYEDGVGVTKSDSEAARYYRLAVEKGHAYAMYRLGRLYFEGRGLSKDEAEAVRLFRQSAELGESEAMRQLGVMSETGQSVRQDKDEASEWYRKAAACGNTMAVEDLKRLGAQ